MTKPGEPAFSAPFGETLPDGARWWFVPAGAARTDMQGRLVAVVPCDWFEQDGFYVLHIADRLCIGRCRAAPEAEEIEITCSTTTTMVGRPQFDDLVVGRVIGTLLPDGMSSP
jgi:hypothetical protein